MALDELPATAINLMVENYNSVAKAIIVILIISLSVLYVTIIKKNEDKTPYLTVGIIRILMTAFSFGTLVSSPLFIFVFNPYFYLYDFLDLILLFYSPFLVIGGTLMLVDIFMFSGMLVLKMGNFDIQDKRVNMIYKKIFKKNNGWDQID